MAEHREAYLGRDARFDALYGSPEALMATAGDVLEHMEEVGVDVSVCFGFAFRDRGLCRFVNDYIVEAVGVSHGRLAGLAAIWPEDGAARKELERCLDAGLHGCGELAPDPLDSWERGPLAPLAEILRERGLPLVVHASEPVGHQYPGKGRFTPEACLALATAYPGLPLILSHMGGGLFVYESMPEVREALADVYYDTAAVPYLYDPAVYDALVATAGAGKLIFGSDYPLLSPLRYLEGLERLAPDHRVAAREQNARRIFKL
jgi:hypothetical protein